jgi:hypothetical protein
MVTMDRWARAGRWFMSAWALFVVPSVISLLRTGLGGEGYIGRVVSRSTGRSILLASLGVVFLSAVSCSPAPAVNADAPRSGGIGTVTADGLQVLNPVCMYSAHGVVASGFLHSAGEQSGGQIALSLLAIGSGGTDFTRNATYPSPQMTGTDVPFRIAVETGSETPWDCNVQVDWAG